MGSSAKMTLGSWHEALGIRPTTCVSSQIYCQLQHWGLPNCAMADEGVRDALIMRPDDSDQQSVKSVIRL